MSPINLNPYWNTTPHWNKQLTKEYSDDTILWRYLTLDKFLKLFSQEGIYFRKLSKLEDPYEGVPIGKYFKESLDTFKCKKKRDEYFKHFEGLRNRLYVNCWNQKEQESFLLWKNYSDINSGISIKTTYGKIKAYFKDFEEKRPLFFGRINYTDTLFNSKFALEKA